MREFLFYIYYYYIYYYFIYITKQSCSVLIIVIAKYIEIGYNVTCVYLKYTHSWKQLSERCTWTNVSNWMGGFHPESRGRQCAAHSLKIPAGIVAISSPEIVNRFSLITS